MSNKQPRNFRAISQQMFVLTVLGASWVSVRWLCWSRQGLFTYLGVQLVVGWNGMASAGKKESSTIVYMSLSSFWDQQSKLVMFTGCFVNAQEWESKPRPKHSFQGSASITSAMIHAPELVTGINLESRQRRERRRGEEPKPHHAITMLRLPSSKNAWAGLKCQWVWALARCSLRWGPALGHSGREGEERKWDTKLSRNRNSKTVNSRN